MNTEIKKYADSGDIKSLKYIFVDALDVDPTFVRYEDEYNYCKSIPGLLESHVELTPFRTNKADWNEEYWTSLKMDLIKNFSDKRLSHMREVAQVFLAEKVQRILAERAANSSVQKAPVTNAAQNSAPVKKQEYVTSEAAEPMKHAPVSKAAEQTRQMEEAKRKLEAENKADMERNAKEQRARSEQQHRLQEQAAAQAEGDLLKKAIGIAVAAITVAVVLFLLLK